MKIYIVFVILVFCVFRIFVKGEAPSSGVAEIGCFPLFSDAFVEENIRYAILGEKEYGIPAKFSIGHAKHESANGKSLLSCYNNLWGIKCQEHNGIGSVDGCCVSLYDDDKVGGYKIKSSFKIYASKKDAWDAYFLKMNSKRYYRVRGSVEEMCYEIKKAGWATDKKYASKLLAMMNSFDL